MNKAQTMQQRRTILFAAAALVGSLANGQLRACECGGLPEPTEAYDRADAVFAGIVVGIDDHATWWRKAWIRVHNWVASERLCESPDSWVKDCGFEIAIAVDQSFKGSLGPEVQVRTGRGGGDCGYPFRNGERYLVYAHRYPTGELMTSQCLRTRPVADAAGDLTLLAQRKEQQR